jgi:hypothetical protein
MARKVAEAEHKGGGKSYLFRCPGCQENHAFYVGQPGLPSWDYNSNEEKPTFSPSLLVRYDGADKQYVCHSFVRDGMIQFLGDCTHELANQTVEIPDWDSG